MKNQLAAFFCGLLFAAGLGISGMTDANKVFAFLNITGDWDPSLAFVMVGAIGVHLVSYRLITKRPSPVLSSEFILPKQETIDRPLVVGAGIFGIGWGLAGFCPGPAVVSIAGLSIKPIVFTISMVIGMGLFRLTRRNQAEDNQESIDACG